MDDDIRSLIESGQVRAAFDLVADRYQHKVYRLAISILRDAGRAEDAAQDVLFKLWRALPGYDGTASLSTWIYTIARNTCVNQLRKESYRKAEPLDPNANAAASPDDDPAGVTAGLDAETILNQLPENYRQVLVLYYLQEKSCEEVAEMLNIAVGTVKSSLHRARRLAAGFLAADRGCARESQAGSKR